MSAVGSLVSPATQVKKRAGRIVDFKPKKILQAVRMCLINGCGRSDNDATTTLADKVAKQVGKIIEKINGPVHVEAIQDLVEQSLMVLDEHEAARQYIIYREEHRKLREASEVDQTLKKIFDDGLQHFCGTNRDLQIVQSFDKFSQYRDELGSRREVWPETVDRVMKFFNTEIVSARGGNVPAKEWEWLRHGLLTQMAAPSMRAVQLAGPALHRCNSGVNNCSYLVMDSPESLAEDLYLLMQGCGVGFSVENEIASDLWPRVKRQSGATKTIIVPDTTEGWCDTLKESVHVWLDGGDVEHDVTGVRPEGAILKTKGGTSSGPGPLLDLLNFARRKIISRQGGCLSSLDIHDITCFAHRIVQMGGVRRASGISLSDLLDPLMRDCKAGEFYVESPHRNQANNSTAYTKQPSMSDFLTEWGALVRGCSGERGIFNREGAIKQMPARRRANLTVAELRKVGCNPCGEIIELDRTFCNLSIGVVRPDDTVDQLKNKIAMASAWGTMQSAMTRYNYLRDDWKANVEKERLLGVDLLGHFDHHLIGAGAGGDKAKLLRELQSHAITQNQRWAEMCGINPSVAVTCNKPSGDSSVFYDTSAGFKAHHGEYFIRRLRMKPNNPIAQLLKDSGVPHQVDYDRSGLLVFEFPCQAPVDNPILIGQQSSLEQLEHWKVYKLNWTEHNPSCTIYVCDTEWMAVGAWVWENWDIVGGLSFFPLDTSVYKLAPYETISREEFAQRKSAMPSIEWAKLTRYETRNMTELKQHAACSGDKCEV
jgi:ribonucleoside-triphosphate reductase